MMRRMDSKDGRKVFNGFFLGLIIGAASFAALFPHDKPIAMTLSLGMIVTLGSGCLGALLAAMFFLAEEH